MTNNAKRLRAAVFVTGAGLMTGLLTAGPATATEPKPWNVSKLHEFFCAEEGHSQQFYDEWSKAEKMLPYELKMAKDPAEETRKKLFGDGRLTADTAKKICDGMDTYTQQLKAQILDLKGDLKPQYATAEGVKRFIHEKEVVLTEAALHEQDRQDHKG
ncbi:hypothetical protein J4573_27005 [Actinomadura barringtoniae]|uniref:Uncharacterized protein n=1 Tax=Actinomadura barringtoniae TaxID=1427535 RepID=A0A939PDT8_9ACTN|nr:hypothetical protein [Actinomadura barringtoniae]MBO2450776.1 hypothetical protein [Actinomadura barringtoniae]